MKRGNIILLTVFFIIVCSSSMALAKSVFTSISDTPQPRAERNSPSWNPPPFSYREQNLAKLLEPPGTFSFLETPNMSTIAFFLAGGLPLGIANLRRKPKENTIREIPTLENS